MAPAAEIKTSKPCFFKGDMTGGGGDGAILFTEEGICIYTCTI